MKDALLRILKRNALSPLETVLIMTLLAATGGIGLYAHYTLDKIRQGLPAEILNQAGDLTLLIQDLTELLHSVELATGDPTPERRAAILARNDALRERMATIRTGYVFDNLVGAASVHALVNPASEDIQRWLTQGVHELPPDSAAVLTLVEARARDAYVRARDLSLDSSAAAIGLLGQETMRLDRFRWAMPILLSCLVTLALIVVNLFVRQRRVEARLAAVREQLVDAIESIPEGFVLCDAQDKLVACNEQYLRMYPGVREVAVPGAAFGDVVRTFYETRMLIGIEGNEDEALQLRMTRHRNPGPPFEHRLRDGRCIRISERRTSDGGAVGIHADITDVRKVQERLRHMATHDTLTGLPNRVFAQERLEQLLLLARRRKGRFSVLYLDLDRFKLVNDTLGHHAGDELLRAVAGRLKGHLRDGDTLARLGGDEFIVILADVADIVTATSSARRLIQALERPFQVFGQEVFIATSIGVASFPEHGDSIDALLQNADAATYHAKAQGPNMLCLYTPALNAETCQRMHLENDLRRALERGELVLHFQPRMDIIGGRLVGAEALLRWRHADRGLMRPLDFIEIAEDTGLIVPIGEWVLRQACEQFCTWQAAGVAPPRLSVNVSARQLGHPELHGVIVSALEEAGMAPDALELEITEGTLMEHVEGGIARLQELGAMGVHLSIDDFGTGYSSLSMLKRLPIDALKIDRSFVADIAVSPNDQAITTAIIAMADTLELKVVAEGVETQAQLDLLRKWGCAEAQGTFFSGPLALEPFVELLHGVAVDGVRRRTAAHQQQLGVSEMGM